MTGEKIEWLTESPEATQKLALEILSAFPERKVFALYGDLGAGKTTLTQALCRALGVEDTVKSPTFSIVNEYDSDQGKIYHFDFYRIEREREALDIGVDEYFYSGSLCLLEWSENIKGLIPERHLEISIKLVGDKEREVTISPNDG